MRVRAASSASLALVEDQPLASTRCECVCVCVCVCVNVSMCVEGGVQGAGGRGGGGWLCVTVCVYITQEVRKA